MKHSLTQKIQYLTLMFLLSFISFNSYAEKTITAYSHASMYDLCQAYLMQKNGNYSPVDQQEVYIQSTMC